MPGREISRIVTLRDGASVKLRPIVPEGKPLLVDVFERLSKESRQRRYFTNLRELSPARSRTSPRSIGRSGRGADGDREPRTAKSGRRPEGIDSRGRARRWG